MDILISFFNADNVYGYCIFTKILMDPFGLIIITAFPPTAVLWKFVFKSTYFQSMDISY
jgi:hypothetical protein